MLYSLGERTRERSVSLPTYCRNVTHSASSLSSAIVVSKKCEVMKGNEGTASKLHPNDFIGLQQQSSWSDGSHGFKRKRKGRAHPDADVVHRSTEQLENKIDFYTSGCSILVRLYSSEWWVLGITSLATLTHVPSHQPYYTVVLWGKE